MKSLCWIVVVLPLLPGCVGKPDNVVPVEQFDANRYLGTWYEIARLDHSFERGMERVTADYSLKRDGGIKVVNRGYKAAKGKWSEAVGRAYFVKRRDQGFLKVSFFRPFYGSYVVFDLDQENYSYSMVCGPDKSYLWLLSRTPTLDPAVQERLVAKARSLGFDTSKLVYVKHDPDREPTATPP